mmetsp:Transcript_1833/g.2568  ORF Transcript_1833/g.2568 Transcript_1833/m.2568 type:complete len:426 (+) Transcript_1833:180-1457(+)
MNSYTSLPAFEFLVPEDTTFNSFRGCFSIKQSEFWFRIVFPDCPIKEQEEEEASCELSEDPACRSLEGAIFECDKELFRLTESHQRLIKQRFKQSQNLREFIRELREITEHAMTTAAQISFAFGELKSSSTKRSGKFPDINTQNRSPVSFRKLMAQLDAIGWSSIKSIDNNLSKLTVEMEDSNERKHQIRIIIPSTWPSDHARALMDIPVTKGEDPEDTKGGTLPSILRRCRSRFDTYHDFWRAVEDIDQHTCVLEPLNASRSCTTRRIVLQRHCSVQLEIDPHRPMGLCEIRFLGSEEFTGALMQKLNRNATKWRADQLPRKNLEDLLEIKFPEARATETEDFELECSICYSYRLEPAAGSSEAGETPDRICDDVKCGRPFHRSCLVEWLRAIPTTQQSFQTLFGKCPYCQNSITVDIGTGRLK